MSKAFQFQNEMNNRKQFRQNFGRMLPLLCLGKLSKLQQNQGMRSLPRCGWAAIHAAIAGRRFSFLRLAQGNGNFGSKQEMGRKYQHKSSRLSTLFIRLPTPISPKKDFEPDFPV